jgi:hypothetical protein
VRRFAAHFSVRIVYSDRQETTHLETDMNAALYIKTVRVVSASVLFGKREPVQLGFAVIDSENGEQLSCHKSIGAARDAVEWHTEDRRRAAFYADMGD